MAKQVVIKQGLTWDPNLVVNMESASNYVEKTLGMARNVAFLMGGLTIYLQVHILENLLNGWALDARSCQVRTY